MGSGQNDILRSNSQFDLQLIEKILDLLPKKLLSSPNLPDLKEKFLVVSKYNVLYNDEKMFCFELIHKLYRILIQFSRLFSISPDKYNLNVTLFLRNKNV